VDGAHIRTLLLTLFYRQMPELIARGYVYIAQPPLYKVKAGRDERYLKDEQEEAVFMMQLALKDATLIPTTGAAPIAGAALAELARIYTLADAVIGRASRMIDEAALSAMAEGVEIKLNSPEVAQESAQRLERTLYNPLSPLALKVFNEVDPKTEKQRLIVHRIHHGNVRVSVIDTAFVDGADYGILAASAQTFLGLMGKGAFIARGEGDKRKEAPVSDFREAIRWLKNEAENMVSKQRYKGLGEMNAEQLWETTMNPAIRRLLRVQIEDAIAADEVFTTLMGDDVEPRRAFIETHALSATNIDI
jgi:DNA gyrase subunit B